MTMSCVDYCTVLPSWEFDKDPACIVTYAFGKENDKSEIDDTGEGTPERYYPSNSLILQCPSGCDELGEREPCMISVTCKPQYRVSVTGVHITSESRTVEVYDTSEGYLMTARGSSLQVSDGEGGEGEQQTLYRCKINLKESLYGLSAKFLSLRGKDTLTLYNIMFILNPETEDFSASEKSTPGLINMSKVKDYVHDMGDTIPEGARNLLQSMEDYQANQKSAMSGIQGLMAQRNPSGDRFGMLGLMSILSQVSNTSNLQRNLNSNPGPSQASGSLQQNDHVIHAGYRTDSLKNEDTTGLYKNEANEMENVENEDMFRMLQNICGKVTNLREKEKIKEGIQENAAVQYDESGEIVPCTESSNECMGAESLENATHVPDEQLKDLEQRLTEHIDKKMTELEERLNDKLDKIMNFLSVFSDGRMNETYEKSSQTLNFEDGIDDS